MTITWTIAPAIEAQLRQYLSQGDHDSVRRLVANAIAPLVESSLHASAPLSEEEFEALADQMADIVEAAGAPPLSDYAVSREGIYEGHPKL